MKTALAALMGIVALGGLAVRQWLKYKHQTLKYHMELTGNIYFRNVNNNAGIFDHLIATAEDQETKEASLAYHFIRKAEGSPTAAEVAGGVETWLARTFSVNVDFNLAHALEILNRFGLMRDEGERLSVLPLEPAIAQLHHVWDGFFSVSRWQPDKLTRLLARPGGQ